MGAMEFGRGGAKLLTIVKTDASRFGHHLHRWMEQELNLWDGQTEIQTRYAFGKKQL